MPHVPLRIGIVGAGGIVREKHIPGFRAIPDCTVLAVANRSPASSRKVANEFGIPEIETDWKSLVARPDLNAIVVGTWPYMHKDVVLAALAAGKHVLCESRMCCDAAESRLMFAASEKARKKHGLVSMLCPPPTGFKGDYVMRKAIDAGVLGKPYLLSVRHCGKGQLDPSTPLHWRQVKEFQGLNMLALGLVYEALERWFGPATSVQAKARTYTAKRPLGKGGKTLGKVERPDALTILADFRNGLSASMLLSGVSLAPAPNYVEAWGSAGMLRYSLDEDRVWSATVKDPELREIPIAADNARTWRVEDEFVSAIRNGTPVSPSFADGVKYMTFTEAVEQASKSGKRVSLRSI